MKKNIIYGVALVLLIVNSWAWSLTDEELQYPDIGILSTDASDHYRAWGKTLLSEDWFKLVDKYNNYCKTTIDLITLGELASLLVFSETEVMPMTAKAQGRYDQESDYFKTCNYIEHYVGVWEVWDDRKNQLLAWGNSDAYIDTEYSLLLIKFIDKDESISFDQRRVSALFIRKDFQFGSNRQVAEGAWGWLKYLLFR